MHCFAFVCVPPPSPPLYRETPEKRKKKSARRLYKVGLFLEVNQIYVGVRGVFCAPRLREPAGEKRPKAEIQKPLKNNKVPVH